MLFPLLTEINLLGVYDRGIPNKERIVLKTQEQVNLGKYGIMLGRKVIDGLVIPSVDQFYWFGEVTIPQFCWLILYTCPGKNTITQMSFLQEPAYTFHWGKNITVFHDINIVPNLFSIGSILTGNSPSVSSP